MRPRGLLVHIWLIACGVVMTADGKAAVCQSVRYRGLILDTRVVRNAEGFLGEAFASYHVTLNNSFRSYKDQDALYRRWIARGKKGNPAAKAGTSRHESGFALDLNGLQELTFIQWDRLLIMGEKYGFKYLLGDFPGEGSGRFDWPHFEADPRDYGVTFEGALADNRIVDQAITSCPWKADFTPQDKVSPPLVEVSDERLVLGKILDGMTVTFLDARIRNGTSEPLGQIELRVDFKDSLGAVMLVRFIHPVVAREDPLTPGETRTVHLLVGRVYDFWQEVPPTVSVTYMAM